MRLPTFRKQPKKNVDFTDREFGFCGKPEPYTGTNLGLSLFSNKTVVGTREFRFVGEDIDLVRSQRSRRLRFHVSGYGCAQKNFDLGTPDMAGTTIDGTIVEFFFIGDIPTDGYDKLRPPKLLFPITEN
ncbi:hypothetical protein AAVH_35786 [Aphelenchoides avenae]|nr:hypothetical protein AAVH_35786 [Aphelenchus avenae]